jgi:hypothetical protein
MTDIRNVGQEVQAEIAKTMRRGQESMRKGQEMVFDTIKTWSGTVRTKAPALPDLNLPFASKLPKPEELAGNAYSLAMKLLADQRKFAEGVLRSTAQRRPGNGRSRARKTTPDRHESARSGETASKHPTASKHETAHGQPTSKQEAARDHQAPRGRQTAGKQEPAGATRSTARTARTAGPARKSPASGKSAAVRKTGTAK